MQELKLNSDFNYQDYAEGIYAFNNICGNTKKVTQSTLLNQLKLIQEETVELQEGFDNKSTTEILDACADILYVTVGMLQQLELLGVNVKAAMQQVHLENMLKFPTNLKDAIKAVDHYQGRGVDTEYSLNNKYNVYVVKDTNGKVRKPADYCSTDLSKHVPADIQDFNNIKAE